MTDCYRAPGLADSVGVTCPGGPAGTATAVPAFAQPPPAAPAPGVGHDRAPSLDVAHDGGMGVGHGGAVCGAAPDGAPGRGTMHGGGTGQAGAIRGSMPDGAPGAGRPHGGGGGHTCTHGGGQAGTICGSTPDGASGAGRMHGGGTGQARCIAGAAGIGSMHGIGVGHEGIICGSMPGGDSIAIGVHARQIAGTGLSGVRVVD